MKMSKLTPDQKKQIQTNFPPMVGDIDIEEHQRRLGILQTVRARIEAGELAPDADPILAVDAMFKEEDVKKPKKVKP